MNPRSALVTVLLTAASPSASAQEWTPLFNGRDLTGWDVKLAGRALGDDERRTFRVEDGLLRVTYEDYDDPFEGEFGHLVSREAYDHYELRVEYRFVGEQVAGGAEWARRNSGVMIHSQSASSMGLDQEFPVSIEVQFLGGLGEGARPTANLCTPGTHVVMDGRLVTEHCIEAASSTYDGDQWVTVEVEVRGGRVIRHRIDGEVVLEYRSPQVGGEFLPPGFPLEEGAPLTRGHIALQAESHPVEFRRVELRELPGEP